MGLQFLEPPPPSEIQVMLHAYLIHRGYAWLSYGTRRQLIMQATNELFVKAMHTTLNDLDTARCLYEKLDELVNAEEDPAQS